MHSLLFLSIMTAERLRQMCNLLKHRNRRMKPGIQCSNSRKKFLGRFYPASSKTLRGTNVAIYRRIGYAFVFIVRFHYFKGHWGGFSTSNFNGGNSIYDLWASHALPISLLKRDEKSRKRRLFCDCGERGVFRSLVTLGNRPLMIVIFLLLGCLEPVTELYPLKKSMSKILLIAPLMWQTNTHNKLVHTGYVNICFACPALPVSLPYKCLVWNNLSMKIQPPF